MASAPRSSRSRSGNGNSSICQLQKFSQFPSTLSSFRWECFFFAGRSWVLYHRVNWFFVLAQSRNNDKLSRCHRTRREAETTELSWVIVVSDVWLSVTCSGSWPLVLWFLGGLAYRRLICGKLRFMASSSIRLALKVAYQIKELSRSQLIMINDRLMTAFAFRRRINVTHQQFSEARQSCKFIEIFCAAESNQYPICFL